MKRTILALVLVAAFGSACTGKKAENSNTLRLATPAKIKGLDPVFADDLYSGTEVGRVYQGLVQYHYLKRPYEMLPSLAEALPEISADGKTYVFKLRKGILFHDNAAFAATGGKGRELVAEDIVYSWKRLADVKLNSPGWWIFDGKIVGLNEWREANKSAATVDYAAPVEGLKAVDAYTLQVKLTQASSLFIYYLAMPFAMVVPREAVEKYGKEFQNHPVGTGPYRMVEFNGQQRIIYEKNPTFSGETFPAQGEARDAERGLLADAGKPVPFVDRVSVTVFEEQQPMWLTFLKGDLDISGIPKDNFDSAIDPKTQELRPELVSKNLTLHKFPQLDITHTSFNMADPLFGKNKLLRQALSVAYDEGPAIQLFYNGRAIAAQGPIPPGIAGYDEAFQNPYRKFSLEKAKELLAKAGYPGGKGLPVVEYNTLADSTNRQMAEYLQKQFEPLGVKLKVNTYSWPEFQQKVKTRQGQLWSFAWGADYPDAENFLQLFYGKNAAPGPNDANYMNPEYDRLYEKLVSMKDGPARLDVIKKMVRIVTEDCPWIFGVHRLGFNLTQARMKNFKYHEFDHGRVKYYRLDLGTGAKSQ